MPARARALLPIAMLIALILGACSSERTLDGDRLEAEIEEQLLPGYPGAIQSVSCPDAASPAPGQSLLCLANLGGQVVDVRVTIGGTEDALTTQAVVEARFVAIDEVSAMLAATFGDQVGVLTSVDCGQPVVVLSPDDSVECRVSDPRGVTRIFDVVVDDSGTISVELR